MNILKPHPTSLIPPPLTPEEDAALGESIIKNGQLEDITVYDGMILNGNHRYRHCIKNGIEPRIKEFIPNGVATPEDFVLAHLEGRHLSLGQRACVAAIIANKTKKDPLIYLAYDRTTRRKIKEDPKEVHRREFNSKTTTKIARAMRIGTNIVAKAGVLLKHDKKLFNKVYRGECSVECAYSEHRRNVGSKTNRLDETKANLSILKTTIKIPQCFDSRDAIELFIKSMNAHGWCLEMRFSGGKIYAHWFGNGYPTLGNNWSSVHAEFEFRRAVVVAANDKRSKILLS